MLLRGLVASQPAIQQACRHWCQTVSGALASGNGFESTPHAGGQTVSRVLPPCKLVSRLLEYCCCLAAVGVVWCIAMDNVGNGIVLIKYEPRVGVRAWDDTGSQDAGPLRGRAGEGGFLQRGVSSEESWYSGSDRDMSSGEESEKSSVHSIKSNGQLKLTLNKAKHLCDKLRNNAVRDTNCCAVASLQPANSEGRLARWFSIRRGTSHQYDVDATERATGVGNMPLLVEVEEEQTTCTYPRRQVPPSLPAPPADLTPLQLKRRHIVAAIVHSENSYVATLQRLVNDYKKPLEEANPPILSSSKISTLFHRLPEILQCHTLFRIALGESVRSWDKEERLGDVFVASFSKAVVLDVYSGFINNFSAAMDLAKMEAKRKSALADFLKVKQISAHDRLSFFGLMVKPVQRFPQFILFLQDLLKHTPHGHHDRMSLQLALTQLESLAELLNERKREAEQFQAFKETLRHLSSKFTVRPLSDANRCLLREDDVTQLEFNANGLITKSKRRRLLLLNDLVVCVAVTPKQSEDFGSSERLSLKWTVPVMDIEVIDTTGSPTLSRLLAAGLTRNGSIKSTSSTSNADNLCVEMNQLMHDYEVVSRIADLVASLNGSYQGFTTESTKQLLASIQSSIQRADEQMAWVDSCCLQVAASRGSKAKDDVRYTFQTCTPAVKKEWTTELRLAQLALDVANSPAWEVPEQERRPSAKMPLFVRAQQVHKGQQQTEVTCGCFYLTTAVPAAPGSSRRRPPPASYLWLCTLDAHLSHISVLTQAGQGQFRDVAAFNVDGHVTAVEYVQGDTVWLGTSGNRLLIYGAAEPEKQTLVGSADLAAGVAHIRYHCGSVYVALTDGNLLQFGRSGDGEWDLDEPHSVGLGSEPVSCLLAINAALYAACGKKVWVLTGDQQKSFNIQHEHVGHVNLMAHSGVGLWISLHNSSTVCLYHTETFKHLQDINIASNVARVASSPDCDDCTVTVTALMACKGLLWVGTNVGVALTIPLPRLEGVPIISGRVNISYHAHYGPITFLLALQPRSHYQPKVADEAVPSCDSIASKIKQQLTGSPVVLRRRRSKESPAAHRASKTLPRGLGGFSTSTISSGECDVYGLYGELMYVRDYDGEEGGPDPAYEALRRSDPELAAIPNKVSTLDRRLKMKVGRPRSLDLSNWSMDSHASSAYTTSSEDTSCTASANVSRNSSVSHNDSVSRNGSSVSAGAKAKKETTAVTAAAKVAKCAADSTRRTVITLMGGRGYVNYRLPQNPDAMPNMDDAHIVVWEMKL